MSFVAVSILGEGTEPELERLERRVSFEEHEVVHEISDFQGQRAGQQLVDVPLAAAGEAVRASSPFPGEEVLGARKELIHELEVTVEPRGFTGRSSRAVELRRSVLLGRRTTKGRAGSGSGARWAREGR